MENNKTFMTGFKEGQRYFGENISAVVNLVLLSFVYIVGAGLTSLAARFFGKSFLDKKIDSETKSYWENLNLKTQRKEAYYRQF